MRDTNLNSSKNYSIQWPWKISDTEFVRRVDRFQTHWRRPFAISMIVFSAIFIGMGIFFISLIERGEFPRFPDKTTQNAFQFGVIVGSIGGQCVYFAMFTLLAGVYWLFARRKDQLLMKYHQRLLELEQLDPDGLR